MSFLKRLFGKKRPAPKPKFSLPAAWTVDAPMKRIIIHWTAGSYVASALDKEHYHFLIEGDLSVARGLHSVKANVPPLKEGRYAAHTRKTNSYAIGVGICAMNGAKQNPLTRGRYPLTELQWKKTAQVVAALARVYDIPVNEKHILTHAEVQVNLGIWQRGKWDVAWLPFFGRKVSAKMIGDKLRREVAELV